MDLADGVRVALAGLAAAILLGEILWAWWRGDPTPRWAGLIVAAYTATVAIDLARIALTGRL